MPKTKKRKNAQPITQSNPHRDLNERGPALIRKFHTLQSALATAISTGDVEAQQTIQYAMDKLGGLDTYQKASMRGQDKRRGGDSSKILVEWLKAPDLDFVWPALQDGSDGDDKARVLEIGSLSTDNYISRYPRLAVSRIDLHAQHPRITQQDFLVRPCPASAEDAFHGISCSLVLNFVASSDRADFLLHLTRFLPVSDATATRWLFFVLPTPCIHNSRYMNKTLLLRMLETLGFAVVKEKITDRIAYWLFKRVAEVKPDQVYGKRELQSGKTRNNFFIALHT